MTFSSVISLKPPSAAERLEQLARRPLQPRRDLLLMLAGRLRALDGLDRGHHRDLDHDQLELVA